MLDDALSEGNRIKVMPGVATVATMGLIMVLAAALRLHELDVSLWLDEVLTHHGASGSFLDSLTHRTYPLYYALANVSLRFRDTEVALRFPSFAAGLLTLPAVYFLARSWAGHTGGLLAALLLCVSAFHIRYSQEARFYALVMLGGTLMTFYLHRCITQGGRRNWAAFCASAFLSLLAQLSVLPFFLSLVAGAAVWLSVEACRRTGRAGVRLLIILCVAAALSMSGLVLSMLVQRDSGLRMLDMDTAGEEDDGGPSAAAASPTHLYSLTLREYAEFVEGFLPVPNPAPQLALAVAALVGMIVLWRRNRALAFLFLVQFLLAPIPYFLLKSSHWYAPRYFCNLTPLYVALVAGGIVAVANAPAWVYTRIRGKAGADSGGTPHSPSFPGIVLTIVFVAVLTPNFREAILHYYERRPAADWRAIGEFIAARIEPGDVLVMAPPPMGTSGQDAAPPPASVLRVPVEFYLRRSLPAHFPRSPNAVAASLVYASANTADAVRACRTEHAENAIWWVLRNEKRYAAEFREALDTLDAKRMSRFGRVAIRRMRPLDTGTESGETDGNG
ncbi:MAG: glycosyltransferase family 39 protein [Candidatus Hydrogenedentes bacterium]|nr:glycosyltransferase family 39 protein [Candidatus Hydrogenedentota bacterium]